MSTSDAPASPPVPPKTTSIGQLREHEAKLPGMHSRTLTAIGYLLVQFMKNHAMFGHPQPFTAEFREFGHDLLDFSCGGERWSEVFAKGGEEGIGMEAPPNEAP